MTEKSKALRLAEWLYNWPSNVSHVHALEAAAELRRLHDRDKEWESVTRFMQITIDRMEGELLRLHEANQELLEALGKIAGYELPDELAVVAVARAAIAKHGGAA